LAVITFAKEFASDSIEDAHVLRCWSGLRHRRTIASAGQAGHRMDAVGIARLLSGYRNPQ
jgi:ribosomal protein S13